jgi:hypothetical protein
MTSGCADLGAVAGTARAEVSGLTMTILTLEDLSAKLVELESHPGREHLRRYAPTGVTAQRWAVGRRHARAACGTTLADQSDDLEQANSVYPEVKQFFDAVDEINTTVAKLLAPLLKRIDAVGAQFAGSHRPVGDVGIRSTVSDDGRHRRAHRRDYGSGYLPG